MQAGARFCSFVRFQKRLYFKLVLESRFGAFGVSYRKKTEFRGMPENVLISRSIFLTFSTSKMAPQIDKKNHNKPMFGAILGQDGSKEALLIGLISAKACEFQRFRIEICCIHEITYLSLYCTGNIIFFVIFTHSIHKFLPLSLIPPHKNHPVRRSVRSTHGF